MKLTAGDLVYIVTLRDGLGRPRAWRLAEFVGVDGNRAVVSYYKSFKDEEKSTVRVLTGDLERYTEKDMKRDINGYKNYVGQFGGHRCKDWKLLEERGVV